MMKKTIRRIATFASVMVLGSMLSGTSIAAEPLKLKFTTGAAGGIFFIQAGVISEILKKEYPGSEINAFPGGAIGNLGVVSKGISDIGLTHINMYPLALKGEAPFKNKYDNVAAIMKHGYYSYAQLLVTEDSGIKSFEDIKTKKIPLKIATTSRAGASYWMGVWLLEEYGISTDTLKSWGGDVVHGSMNDHVNWFRDGQVNAWAGGGHLPSNAPLQISQFTKVRLLNVDKSHLDNLTARILGAQARTIPAGTYPKMANGSQDVHTFSDPGGIIVRKDMPEDVVYRITKALVENEKTIREGAGMEEFDPKTAWQNIGPLHPGAAKYFKERGWMK